MSLEQHKGAAPATIIAKCPSHDEASRNIAKLTGTYVKEVSWYRELAADSGDVEAHDLTLMPVPSPATRPAPRVCRHPSAGAIAAAAVCRVSWQGGWRQFAQQSEIMLDRLAETESRVQRDPFG